MRSSHGILVISLAVTLGACAVEAVNASGGGAGGGAGSGGGQGGAGGGNAGSGGGQGGSAGSGGGQGGAGGGQGGAGGGQAGAGGGQGGAGGGQAGAGGGQAGGGGGAADCTDTGCGAGEECCAATGACYAAACLGCCQLQPELCADRVDNDGDGSTDCADADCAGDPACQAAQEVCGNGLDDDGDGEADCADLDCAAEPGCQGPELCENGIDDDGDGDSDCGDTDCASSVACRCATVRCSAGNTCCPFTGSCEPDACLGCCQPVAEICDNGLDDDGDGVSDCGDADCVDFGSCRCALVRCAQGFSCCPFTGSCEPDACLGCCQPVAELCGNGADDDGDGLIDCDDRDCAADPACAVQADCNVTGCAAGLDCCPGSGVCFDPRCLACCM